MGLLLWIVFGAIAGWIASLLMKSEGGLLWDILVGIVGAVVGGFVMSLLGQGGVGGFNLYSFLVAILGACIFIAILRAVRR
ncbi:MAG: GlsB/YeaQ/YmgE family stress response membrane protein [Patescibacteria group bacterium]